MRLEEARREILNRIGDKVGYSIREDTLSPTIRQAITSLANIWRNVVGMKQLALGEKSRVEQIKSYSAVIGVLGLIFAIFTGVISSSLSFIIILLTFIAIYFLYSQYQKSIRELNATLQEISTIEDKISSKINELSGRILREQKIGWVRQNIPVEEISQIPESQILELRCPNCGASLPLPTGSFVQCPYCGTVLSIKDIGLQIKALIDSI